MDQLPCCFHFTFHSRSHPTLSFIPLLLLMLRSYTRTIHVGCARSIDEIHTYCNRRSFLIFLLSRAPLHSFHHAISRSKTPRIPLSHSIPVSLYLFSSLNRIYPKY
ncbi:hypothetical protein BC629DRAFT_1055560 [Irpex lacteus]|nr:hypothetical protein BC629DRAFT_1055560 [Irpex lacteus]